ncbi:MAG: hypothetical protein JWQ16_615 [Novosphingobium sp.]|nr:hypothetical protein [Novosphingobium sp.]
MRRVGLLSAALLSGCTGTRLNDFERTLAAQDSATAALGEWCRMRALALPATIRAERLGGSPEASAEIRRLLDVLPGELIAFRHVRLACGAAVLSEADNWYVPGRLTPEMNLLLASTDTPFGKLAAPLGFRRERLEETRGRISDCPAGTVLSHRALLRLPNGAPLSLVTECYTQANLAR